MPDLLDRMLGLLEPEESHLALPYPVVLAAMREIQRGQLTPEQVYARAGVQPEELDAFNHIYELIFGASPTMTSQEFNDLFALGVTRDRTSSVGAPYYDKAKIAQRLGL